MYAMSINSGESWDSDGKCRLFLSWQEEYGLDLSFSSSLLELNIGSMFSADQMSSPKSPDME